MGIFKYIKSKTAKKDLTLFENRLQMAFSKVSSDINQIRSQVSTLHSGHTLTKQEINNLSAWLGYLKRDSERVEKNFEKISDWLIFLNSQHNEIQNKIKSQDDEINSLKQRVATPVATVATPATPNSAFSEPTATDVANVGNMLHVGNATLTTPATTKNLPNPLKQLLNLMMSIGEPVSYSMLSQKLGKNRITIRVNMNRLKRNGLVEEIITPKGNKLFAVKNSEKIKKLYNAEMI